MNIRRKWLVIAALYMCGAAQVGWWAAECFSWRAVEFAFYSAMCLVMAAAAVLAVWLASEDDLTLPRKEQR